MIINILILLAGIPVGLLIAWLARDELEQGRTWFRVLIILSILGIIWFWLVDMPHISLAFGFILILALAALIKGNDKKWTKV